MIFPSDPLPNVFSRRRLKPDPAVARTPPPRAGSLPWSLAFGLKAAEVRSTLAPLVVNPDGSTTQDSQVLSAWNQTVAAFGGPASNRDFGPPYELPDEREEARLRATSIFQDMFREAAGVTHAPADASLSAQRSAMNRKLASLYLLMPPMSEVAGRQVHRALPFATETSFGKSPLEVDALLKAQALKALKTAGLHTTQGPRKPSREQAADDFRGYVRECIERVGDFRLLGAEPAQPSRQINPRSSTC